MIAETVRRWNSFWFQACSPAPLCAFRILFGALLLASGFLLLPDLFIWFGDRGVMSWSTVWRYSDSPRFSLLNFIGASDPAVLGLFWLYMIASLGLCLGVKHRFCAATVFLILATLHHRNPAIINSGDTLLRIFAFLFVFAPAGAMYSLEKRRGDKRRESAAANAAIVVEPWAQRLMQLQISAVYAQTVLAKFDGETWRNGTALYYASRLEELYRLPVPFFFDNLASIKILTWGTLTAEVMLAILIWSRPPWRYYVLGLGVLLHLGIEWSMNIPLFEWIMISSYVLFIEPKYVEAAMNRALKGFVRR